MVRVMAFGTFDCLHQGHRNFLKQAKANGDELIVVVARDATVASVKGHRPMQPEGERLRKVQTLPGVNVAVLGELGDKYEVIRRFQPDAICLGYDQQAFTDRLAATFPQIKIHRLKAYHPERYKSSRRRPISVLVPQPATYARP